MKKYVWLAGLILLFSGNGLAQQIETGENSSISLNGASVSFGFSWGKKKPAKDAHWSGIGFAFSGLKGLGDDIELNYGRSYTFMLNLGTYNIPLSSHWVLASGLGLDWNRYHFNGNVSLSDENGIAKFKYETTQEYKDSKVLLYNLKVPLLLEYQIKTGKKHIFINGAIEGLLKLYSKSQIETKTYDKTQKVDLKGFNMFPVSGRIIMGIGCTGVCFFGYYHPQSLFAKGKGPELHPFGVGIVLSD